jgi:hypothetical protein
MLSQNNARQRRRGHVTFEREDPSMFELATTVYILRCSANHKRYGFTTRNTGRNLPNLCDGGQWELMRSITVQKADKPRMVVDNDRMIADLESKGWHVIEVDVVMKVIHPKP